MLKGVAESATVASKTVAVFVTGWRWLTGHMLLCLLVDLQSQTLRLKPINLAAKTRDRGGDRWGWGQWILAH